MKKVCLIVWALFCAESQAQQTIAIVPFENVSKNQEYQWVSTGLYESLVSGFAQIGQFVVVERAQLDKVLKEQNLQLTDLADESKTVKVGVILGAKKLVVGSYQILGEQININCRILDVESGKVEQAGLIENKSDKISNLFRIQQEICLELARKLGGKISENEIQKVSAVITNSTSSAKAMEYCAKGGESIGAGDYKQAKKFYEKALKEDKNYSAIYLGLGGVAMHNEDYKDAIKYYTKAIDITPNYFQAYSLRGSAHFFRKDYAESKSDLEAALKINPYDFLGYVTLAGVYFSLDDALKAIDCYKSAINVKPNSAIPYRPMAFIYASLNMKEDAIRCFSKFIEMDPKSPNVPQALEWLQRLKGQ